QLHSTGILSYSFYAPVNTRHLLAFPTRGSSDLASTNFFGFDINPDLVKATKMNMVMNNDGSGNILQINTLLPPHEWSDEFKTRLAEGLNIRKSDIRNSKTIEFLDRKSTRLNSSHVSISYAVFCLKKK